MEHSYKAKQVVGEQAKLSTVVRESHNVHHKDFEIELKDDTFATFYKSRLYIFLVTG